jgi:hypothetical protein
MIVCILANIIGPKCSIRKWKSDSIRNGHHCEAAFDERVKAHPPGEVIFKAGLVQVESWSTGKK